jgi:microcystin-dependent protein
MGLISYDIPAGTMQSFGGPISNIPSGWLYCNGASVLRADYPELFAAIGTAWGAADGLHFNLPYTPGLFLRGQADGSGFDPDRGTRSAIQGGGNTGDSVGSYQGTQIQSHFHWGITEDPAESANTWGNGFATSPGNTQTGAGTSGPNHVTGTSSTGGNQTNPYNVYVNYMIKY